MSSKSLSHDSDDHSLNMLLQIMVVCATVARGVEKEGRVVGEVMEVLDDFPLDDPGGATDRVDEGGGDPETNK